MSCNEEQRALAINSARPGKEAKNSLQFTFFRVKQI